MVWMLTLRLLLGALGAEFGVFRLLEEELPDANKFHVSWSMWKYPVLFTCVYNEHFAWLISYVEYGHLIEVYDFPEGTITRDLLAAFRIFQSVLL